MQQLGTASDDEAKSRNALDALVGTADEEVYAQFVYIEGNTAEAAHGVYNQFLAVHLDEVGYLLEGLSTPVVVSQCTTATWVISALCER